MQKTIRLPSGTNTKIFNQLNHIILAKKAQDLTKLQQSEQ